MDVIGHSPQATRLKGPFHPVKSNTVLGTPSLSLLEFEFIVVLNGDQLGIQRLPGKFAKFVADNEPATLQLREAGCGFCRWPVDVLFDGCGKMYLHTGLEKFALFHDLQAGCVLTFSYQGDEELNMKVFDDTSCRWHYHGGDEEYDD
nr:B3 domain-containing protein Os03g0212300-like [Lolium perenne]